jgi:hypothetical protein
MFKYSSLLTDDKNKIKFNKRSLQTSKNTANDFHWYKLAMKRQFHRHLESSFSLFKSDMSSFFCICKFVLLCVNVGEINLLVEGN